jgi:hypothetical protein
MDGVVENNAQTMPKPKTLTITTRVAFSKIRKVELVPRAKNLVQNLREHPEHFGNPPIALDQVDADLDELARLNAESLDGARSVIAQRDKQRDIVINDMRILVRYAENASDGDPAIFKLSGLDQAYASYKRMPMLSERIRKITQGKNSGELLIYINADDDAIFYEIRYGVIADGQPPADWTQKLIYSVKSATLLQGLIAGKSYAFQARIRSKPANEYTDWTNSVTFMPI